jgi:hypothetical protein
MAVNETEVKNLGSEKEDSIKTTRPGAKNRVINSEDDKRKGKEKDNSVAKDSSGEAEMEVVVDDRNIQQVSFPFIQEIMTEPNAQNVNSNYAVHKNELEEIVVDTGYYDKVLKWMIDPFPTIRDKTMQRAGDMGLPIPGGVLSLVTAFLFAAGAPLAMSAALTLTAASLTMTGKVVGGISDRRMLKQPMKAAREAGIDEEELSPKGRVESLAYYANPINLSVGILSAVGIVLGTLFMLNVISNDTNNDTYSSGDGSNDFSNKTILGILFAGVTLVDNCLKILKGCEIEYRDRLTQLSKDHIIQREEIQKLLPDMLQPYYDIIRELIAAIDRSDQVSVKINEEEIGLQMLSRNCIESLDELNHARDTEQFHQKIYSRISKELKLTSAEIKNLKNIEEELEGIQKKLCSILLDKYLDQQYQQAIILWGKITSSILPLCKIKAIREYCNFLVSLREADILPTVFLDPIEDIADRSNTVNEILIRQVDIMNILQDMQISTVKYNREDLDGIINVLDHVNLAREQSAVSNPSMNI